MHMSKLKSYELAALADKISTCPSIEFITGLLVATFIQIYNEKEQGKQGENTKYTI